MQQRKPKTISEISDEIKTYLSTRLEYFRLKTIEKTAKIMADILSSFLLLFFILIAFLAASITLAFYLSAIWGSYTLGFGAASLLFLTISILVLLSKQGLEYRIGSISVKRYFDRHCIDGQDTEHRDIKHKPCEDA